MGVPSSTVSRESSGRGFKITPITRIFVDSTLETGDTLTLPEEEAHHVLKVLRGRPGDALEIVDAERRLFAAELRDASEAAIRQTLEAPEEDVEVSLYQAVPKGGRMDLAVEKATEVGVTRIVPLVTQRGIVEPRGGKVERWRRVAEAAARQSLRMRVPEVLEPAPFAEAVRQTGEGGVLLHNARDLDPLEDVAGSPVSLFIGPEGGWSEEEMRLAREAGLAFAQLGPYRLRSETAGMVAVARARAALE
ncbi:MAG: 16S rRNA (uracil(1498)-N(3))-methyltransferase, partial [Actinomycetota bacterium]|nr:16S rRNA (uracil(1498)-N(3))-methyltransferase [Actinomycetota bacterium]